MRPSLAHRVLALCLFALPACGGGGGPGPVVEAGAPLDGSGGPRRGGGGPISGGGDDGGGGGSGDGGGPMAADGGGATDALVARDAGTSDGPLPDGPAVPPDGPTRDTAADLTGPADTSLPPDTGPDRCGSGGICEQLNADYVAAFPRAQSCNPLLKFTCLEQRGRNLFCGNCPAWVNSAADLDAIAARYADAGCNKCLRPCPSILCRALSTGECRKPLLATMGSCADMTDR